MGLSVVRVQNILSGEKTNYRVLRFFFLVLIMHKNQTCSQGLVYQARARWAARQNSCGAPSKFP